MDPDVLERPDRPSRRQIIANVAERHGLTAADLIGPKRTKREIPARFEACYLMCKVHGYSYPHAGRALGGRDHTSVLNGARRFEQSLADGVAA